MQGVETCCWRRISEAHERALRRGSASAPPSCQLKKPDPLGMKEGSKDPCNSHADSRYGFNEKNGVRCNKDRRQLKKRQVL